MSINKVLNRPMFRQQALKKGHIKVIKAQTGEFIGPARPMGPYQPTVPSTSVVRPGFIRRGINTMGAIARSPIGKGIGATLSLPGYVGFEATGQVANAMGMQDSPYKIPLQLAGAYGATKLPGAAALAGMGMGPQLGIAALGGAGYFAYLKAKEQQARIAAMTPKERE